MVKIGIPQGLLFYSYGALWKDYFTRLGLNITTSLATTKKTLTDGTNVAVDESCLPLKIFLGHVKSLLDDCSHIFVPRIAQHHKDYYYCAKFAGLPDIVRNTFNLDNNRILSPNIENKNFSTIFKACQAIAVPTRLSPIKAYYAYRQARQNYKQEIIPLLPDKQILVGIVGHSYLIHDPFLTHEIRTIVSARGLKIISPDQIPAKILYNLSSEFHPEVYWQLSAKLVGAAQYFSTLPNVKGIMVVSSFGCGPDSLINEYISERILKNAQKPYTFINFDEHTGNAGIITRVEAFLDLIEWRQEHS